MDFDITDEEKNNLETEGIRVAKEWINKYDH